MASSSSSKDKEKESFEFDCPECGTHISGDSTKCPKCGVEFIIEEVSESECPECGKLIPSDSEECPACGAKFELVRENEEQAKQEQKEREKELERQKELARIEAEQNEELKKQFPLLVAEVKPLMAMAKDFDIDTAECRRLIDKAVRAGKQKDIATAVQCVKECRSSVRFAIEERLTRDVEHLEKLIEVAKSMNGDTAEMTESINKMREGITRGDLQAALEESKTARKTAEKVTGKYIEAHDICESLDKLVQNSERFYVDVREARNLLKEAQEAGERGDWSMMGILSRKGREDIMKTLPDVLKSEMRKAKSTLLDSKADGKDVSVMVKILKDAGMAMKREKYEETLDRLIEFKAEMKRI
jgi:RNA polymerase subunit RPABC4/transcription elongation factor Spt4